MDRLLTKQERDEVYDAIPITETTMGAERSAYCKAQDAKTLRKLVEWLDDNCFSDSTEDGVDRIIRAKDWQWLCKEVGLEDSK